MIKRFAQLFVFSQTPTYIVDNCQITKVRPLHITQSVKCYIKLAVFICTSSNCT